MAEITVTDKGLAVLNLLRGQDAPMTGAEIADATGLNSRGIHGVLNGLFKKGLVDKGEKVTINVVNKEGNEEAREYVTYFITPAGADLN